MTDQLTLTQGEFGGDVTPQGTPDGTVAVSAGSVLVDNEPVSFAAANVTPDAADTDFDRIDAIVVDSSGTLSSITGDVADNLTVSPPDTTGYAVLAYVTIYSQASPFYDGTITDGVIEDKRDFALRHVSPYRVTDLWYTSVGTGGGQSNSYSDGECFFAPFWNGRAMPVKAIGCKVNTAGTAGSKGRLGIYTDDGAGTLDLLVDAGQVAIDATGPQSLTISETLQPGWIWLAFAFQSLGVTIPSMLFIPLTAFSPVGAATLSLAPLGGIGGMYITGVTGALPQSPSGFSYTTASAPAHVCPGVWIQAA